MGNKERVVLATGCEPWKWLGLGHNSLVWKRDGMVLKEIYDGVLMRLLPERMDLFERARLLNLVAGIVAENFGENYLPSSYFVGKSIDERRGAILILQREAVGVTGAKMDVGEFGRMIAWKERMQKKWARMAGKNRQFQILNSLARGAFTHPGLDYDDVILTEDGKYVFIDY